jgi:hypothetical protein
MYRLNGDPLPPVFMEFPNPSPTVDKPGGRTDLPRT